MDELLRAIGDRVRQARMTKHMSQNDLADATGLSVSFLSNIEMGKQARPSYRLCDGFQFAER